jgi:hypothetical protein
MQYERMRSMKNFVLFVMIFALCLISGCQSDPAEKTDAAAISAADAVTDSPGEAVPSHYEAGYLPANKYGNYEFCIMTPPNGFYDNIITLEADVEEESGEILPDAVYKRNRIIEKRYEIVFKSIVVDNYDVCRSRFQNSTRAGSDDFDLCMLLPRYAWGQATEGAVVPVNRLPFLDISQPWYVQTINSAMYIGGKLFFAYSDECLNLLENTSCILFNKKLVESLGLENMYNLVKDGKWTLDKFFDLSKSATADLDGDGMMTDADRYGIVSTASEFLPAFWSSSAINTIGKDENDLHVFAGQNEKLYNILDKVCANLYGGQKIYFDGYWDKPKLFDSSAMQFAGDYGLFFSNCLRAVPGLRAMETDFGIIPFPKYDEAQKIYHSRAGRGWINCVPNGAPDLERTSLIMESLAVESKNHTVPAYHEIMLRTKFLRDDESAEMLDIIEQNRFVDLGDTIYALLIADMLSEYIIFNKKTDFVSAIEKNLGKINEALQKSNEAVLALE